MTGTDEDEPWDEVKDVIVLGSGAAGLVASIVARLEGLDVLLLEKTGYIGGTTAISGGAIWIPDPAAAAALGHRDSAEAVLAYVRACAGVPVDEALGRAFLEAGPAMLDYMAARTHLQVLRHAGSPDYNPALPGAALGARRVDPLPFDGRVLGRHFDELRPALPQFTIFGGMMLSIVDINHLLRATRSPRAAWHAARLLARHAADRLRHRRGTRLLLGNALVARLFRSLLDLGVDYRLRAEGADLCRSGGRINGVSVEIGGRRIRIKARRGVILATGGFAGSVPLRRRFLPQAAEIVSNAPEGNTGDGLVLGESVGGSTDATMRTGAFWAPTSVFRSPDGSVRPMPHLVWDRAKPGIIAVNGAGRRFVNEAKSYHAVVQAMFDGEGANMPAFLVCDRTFMRRWGLGLAHPGHLSLRGFIRSGYLATARTLESLGRAVAIDAAGLAATVERFNGFARTGVDTDFGKGDDAYSRHLGDPGHVPNPCLGPIATPPFYAVRIEPGVIGTARGLRTNVHAQVLHGSGVAIPGLYACGNDMNSLFGGSYPGPGITLGPAMTFGFIAARHIAAAG